MCAFRYSKSVDLQYGNQIYMSFSKQKGIRSFDIYLRKLLNMGEDDTLTLQMIDKHKAYSLKELQCDATQKKGRQYVQIMNNGIETDWFIKTYSKYLFVDRQKRKNCDHNAFEFCVAIILSNMVLKLFHKNSYDDILHVNKEVYASVLVGCSTEKFKKYQHDLSTRNKDKVQKWINTFVQKVDTIIDNVHSIQRVYLEGKHIQSVILKQLNHQENTNADVFVEWHSGVEQKFIGISVKQTRHCTLCNLSIEKMCGDKLNEKKKTLRTLRVSICKDNGINKTNYKIQRAYGSVNSLFYDAWEGTNAYWNSIRTMLKEHNTFFKDGILKRLFPLNSSYPIYSFNGEMFETLHRTSSFHSSLFTEHERYYFLKDGSRCKHAKMFYQLIVEDKRYKVEVRFKGNILSSSAQFLVYEQ